MKKRSARKIQASKREGRYPKTPSTIMHSSRMKRKKSRRARKTVKKRESLLFSKT